MSKKKITILSIGTLFFLFIFFSNSLHLAFADQQSEKKVDIQNTQILVKFKNDNKENDTKNKIKNKLKLKKLDLKKKMKLTKIELLELDSKDDINSILKEFKNDSNVEYVQPNYKLQTFDFVPKDTNFNHQWALSNTGQSIENNNGVNGIDVDILKAWNITTGSSIELVGVLDTGIDIDHEDLKSNIFVNRKEIPGNGKDDDGNGYVDDVNGWNFADDNNQVYSDYNDDKHGTHVAGIIAAEANSKGVIGVAPSIKIVPLKFMSGNEGFTSDAINAIEYADQMGIKIVNCSFGTAYYNDALKDTMEASGIIFVCAGGNTGVSTTITSTYPANYNIPNLISVAAIDNSGNLASFSSYGPNIDIAAPGVDILSTTPDNKYEYMSGTSMAAPFVTGTAALMMSCYDNMENEDIISTIEGSVRLNDNLNQKVTSGGILDVFRSILKTKTLSSPIYKINLSEEANSDLANSLKAQSSTTFIPYAEQIHFGEEGIGYLGNICKNYTDMIVDSPGFEINIGRTYNSHNNNYLSYFGRGWTFSFEASIKKTTSNGYDMMVTLPNGKVETFAAAYVNQKLIYYANDSRDKLFYNDTDKSYKLTTKELISYDFNQYYQLVDICDRYGNQITLSYDSLGRLYKITDTVGREYNIFFVDNSSKLIDHIQDPLGRTVKYEYGQFGYYYNMPYYSLNKVTDPANNTIGYDYTTDGTCTIQRIIDNNKTIVSFDTYRGSLCNLTDEYGKYLYWEQFDTGTYSVQASYYVPYGNYTSRSKKLFYNSSAYVYETIYDDMHNTTALYDNDFGEASYTGENGVVDSKGTFVIDPTSTDYARDSNGNITKVTHNGDNSNFKQFSYDSNNNVTSEIDENGLKIYYIYDSNMIYLQKKAQPLNGTDVYTIGCDESKFAVTNYVYYTNEYTAKGLLRSITDPEGKLTEYTYDSYGNIATIKINGVLITTNTYNKIGWLIGSVSANKGYRTDYIYDNDGRLERKTLSENGGEVTRITYDNMGRKTKEVSPKQYVATDDLCKDDNKDGINDYGPTVDAYNGDVGDRYTYFTDQGAGYGKIQSHQDAEGNLILYTYDPYGNVETETKPNGAVYRYTYDSMDRLTNVYFKDNANTPSEVLLESYAYQIISTGVTQKTYTKQLNPGVSAVTIYTYDFENRLTNQSNPDGGSIVTAYYKNSNVDNVSDANGNKTYYNYDGLNRLSESWTPIGTSDNTNQYMYEKIEYDKAGNKTAEKFGMDKVTLKSVPSDDRLIIKTYRYNQDGKLQYAYVSGKLVSEYTYDSDGNVTKEIDYQNANNKVITEYDNNELRKPLTKTVHVMTGDIYGNNSDNVNDKLLITNYDYDKNGNLSTVTTPDQVTTTYEYDKLNRQTKISQPGKDEGVSKDDAGRDVTISQQTQFNWEGKPSIITKFKTYNKVDTIISTITNTYNQRGFLSTIDVLDNTNNKHYISAYYYDTAGRKTAEVAPKYYDINKALTDMNRTEYTYDRMDRLKTKTEIYKQDPSINTFTSIVAANNNYDYNGNLTYEQDAVGLTSGYGKTYAYTANNNISTMQDAVTKDVGKPYTAKYDYDGLGRKVSETSVNGSFTKYDYDDFNNLISTKVAKTVNDTLKLVKGYTYDNLGNKITETDGNQNITNYDYNALNKVRKITYPGDDSIQSNIVTYQYDVIGNIKSVQDSLGKIDIYTYDNQNREASHLQQKVNGEEPIYTSVKYDTNGNKRFVTDGNGVTTENKFDGLNRIIETDLSVKNLNNDVTQKVTKYDYDKNNNITSQTDAWRNIVTSFDYDPLNRLTTKTANNIVLQKLEYYPNGLQSLSYDAPNDGTQNFRKTQYFYDNNNRLDQTIDPKLHSTYQGYDDVLNKKTQTDGKGNVTTYYYDEFNRLKSVINAKLETTSYSYDGNGNLLTETDGKGNVTTYEYNARNKKKREIDNGGRTPLSPSGYSYDPAKTAYYTYYANGNLKTLLDRNGKTVTYVYDIHDNLKSKSATDVTISFTYDSNKNILTMQDSTGKTTYSYDEENRIKTKLIEGIGTTTYLYDILIPNTDPDAGCIKEVITDPKGNITTNTYDKFDRLYKVNVDNAANSAVYLYYDNGSRKSLTNPDGSKAIYTYYTDGPLNTLNNTKGTWSEMYTYYYDNAHNMISKIEPKGTTSYTYDKLNRLETVTEAGKTTSYTYDAAGNRDTETITLSGTNTRTTYSYNDQNRLLSTNKTNPDGSVETINYFYDNNGNLTFKTNESIKNANSSDTLSVNIYVAGQSDSDDVTFYQYDTFNELIGAIIGTHNIGYSYYGDGLRATKADNGVQTKYIYNEDKVVLELDATGNQIARNVQGKNLISRTTNGQTLYYMYNGHADVTALLSTTGSAIATYYYDAFGNITEQTGSFNNNVTYAGYQYDSETGLYYLNSRMYDPVTARFLQEDDPSYSDEDDPLSLNLYTYCHNEPMMYDDPTGHKTEAGAGSGSIDIDETKLAAAVAAANKAVVAEAAARAAEVAAAQSKSSLANAQKAILEASAIEAKKAAANAINSLDGLTAKQANAIDNAISKAEANSIVSTKAKPSASFVYNGTTTTIDNSTIRPFTLGDSIKYEASRIIPWVPYLNSVNDAKIAFTGSDLVGYYKYENEIQDARFNTVVTVMSVGIASGANSIVNDVKALPIGAGNTVDAKLVKELAGTGVKYTPENIVTITKMPNGKIAWLEIGTDIGDKPAGLMHIIADHGSDFAKKGITEAEIPGLIKESLTNGKIIGYQGKGTGRPIYEVMFNGKKQFTAITVSSNGFVVGANPSSVK